MDFMCSQSQIEYKDCCFFVIMLEGTNRTQKFSKWSEDTPVTITSDLAIFSKAILLNG